MKKVIGTIPPKMRIFECEKCSTIFESDEYQTETLKIHTVVVEVKDKCPNCKNKITIRLED